MDKLQRFGHRFMSSCFVSRFRVCLALLTIHFGVMAAPRALLADTSLDEASINFDRDIAPIFANHCIRCHSPADDNRLTLDRSHDLLEGDFVIPGEPENSRLLGLVSSVAGKAPEMPPEGTALSESQVETLRVWIRQGGHWPKQTVIREIAKADDSWWAYQPLRLSEASRTDWSIDDFVRSRLAEHDLRLSPKADRRTLIRRLTFDLHGLPPTLEEVAAFVNDSDPNAYELLVDRLLDSPRYGERYARYWLDIAHYADTHGFERDKRRDHAWRYRDYVIKALNDDKPYDRFIQEQIAGDVLWPADSEAVIATGFLAAGPWDFVGQVETKDPALRRSARSLDLDDMATQVITSTMAMTIHCARCHDHKLDPVSQREYYQLRTVFAGLKRGERVVSQAELERYETETRTLQSELSKIDLEIGKLEGQGLNLADLVGGGNGLGSGVYRNGIDPRNAKVQTRDFGKLGNVLTNRFSKSDFPFVDGVFIPDGKDKQAEIPISTSGLKASGFPTTSGDAWDVIRNGPVASQHSPEIDGVDFTKDGHSLLGLHANAGISFDVASMREALGQKELLFTAKLGYFGAEGAYRADAWILVDGKVKQVHRNLRRTDGLQSVEIELPASSSVITLIATDGGNGFGHDQIGFGDPKIRSRRPPQLSDEDAERLVKLRQDKTALDRKRKRLGPPPNFYGVVAEGEIPKIKVLDRGDPESERGDPLSPAALSCLSMLNPDLGKSESGQGERRAALSAWITNPENPLTHRVIVNRLWQWHFGRGIVDTPSDFGFGGSRPSHPDLLDWLARELRRQNYSLKAMHRLILLSETYQQSSTHKDLPSAVNQDSDNQWLWRQNPRRLEAEAIRDTVLFVSGKLNLQVGGPGYEDFEYKDAYAPIYNHITADDPSLWRRSIYRFVVRTTPNQFLTTLDCPDPAILTPKRLTTNTPLQSLAMLNNEFMLRQAGYFVERIQQSCGDADQEDPTKQVRKAFQIAFVREPSSQELELGNQLVRDQGLFSLCRALLNSNEFIYVD